MVSILGIARHRSRDGGSVTVLNRIQSRRGGPSSSDDPHSSVDSRGILALLQPPEAGGLILLMLGSPVTPTSRWSLKPAGGELTVSGKRERIWPSGVLGRIG